MSNIPNRETFETAYSGKAPWDIGKPQSVFVAVANKVTGSVLDAGCGTGENALFFAARGHKVIGFDYLREPIERAKQKAAERRVAATFVVLDALRLDAIPEQFDSVIDCGLFHCFSDEDRQRYVTGLASVTKPGGRVLLACFSDEVPGDQGPRRISQTDLRTAFTDGWEIEAIELIRFEVREDMPELAFSPGGPRAWLATIRRG